jgi:hypothetical protein
VGQFRTFGFAADFSLWATDWVDQRNRSTAPSYNTVGGGFEPEHAMFAAPQSKAVLLFAQQINSGSPPFGTNLIHSAIVAINETTTTTAFRTNQDYTVHGSSRIHAPTNTEILFTNISELDQDHPDDQYPDAGYHQLDSSSLVQSRSIAAPRWRHRRYWGSTLPIGQNPPKLDIS